MSAPHACSSLLMRSTSSRYCSRFACMGRSWPKSSTSCKPSSFAHAGNSRVAADCPVVTPTKLSLSRSGGEGARRTARVFTICGLEELVRPPAPNLRGARDDRRHLACRHEQLGGADLDRVGHGHGGDGGAWTDGRLGQAFEAPERIG